MRRFAFSVSSQLYYSLSSVQLDLLNCRYRDQVQAIFYFLGADQTCIKTYVPTSCETMDVSQSCQLMSSSLPSIDLDKQAVSSDKATHTTESLSTSFCRQSSGSCVDQGKTFKCLKKQK